MNKLAFKVGDRVQVKNSRICGTIVRMREANADWEQEDMCELAMDFDEDGGLAFSFGESMLEHESPVESLARTGAGAGP